MSSKSRIDHVAILVDDLKLAEAWYMKRVNGSVTFRDQKYIRIQVGPIWELFRVHMVFRQAKKGIFG